MWRAAEGVHSCSPPPRALPCLWGTLLMWAPLSHPICHGNPASSTPPKRCAGWPSREPFEGRALSLDSCVACLLGMGKAAPGNYFPGMPTFTCREEAPCAPFNKQNSAPLLCLFPPKLHPAPWLGLVPDLGSPLPPTTGTGGGRPPTE